MVITPAQLARIERLMRDPSARLRELEARIGRAQKLMGAR